MLNSDSGANLVCERDGDEFRWRFRIRIEGPEFGTPQLFQECPLPEHLVAWYPGDGNAFDVVGGNYGIPRNVLYAEGYHNQAFSFDSDSSEVAVIDPGEFPLDLPGAITVAAWVRTNDSSGRIASKGNNYELRIAVDRLHFDSQATRCSVSVGQAYGLSFPHGAWIHVAGTTNAERTVKKLYLNGELIAINTYDGEEGCGSPVLNNISFKIGNELQGQVDDVMVFDAELSESQIRAVMGNRCIPEIAFPVSCIPHPEGLIGWWAGDGSGENLAGGNNATLIREMGFTEGLVNEAFHNPGGDISSSTNPMRAEINYSPGLDTDRFTIMAWIRPNDTNGMIVERSNEYQLEISGGQGRFRVYTPGFYGVASPPYSYNVPDNEWTHIAGVYDGSSIQLYINGALAGVTSGGERRIGNNPEIRIGRLLPGDIDEVMLYNRALSREEIRQIVLTGNYGVCR